MKLRKLIPLSVLLLAAGTGCQHSASAASAAASPDPIAQTPAPFATPPVLPGTPDIATLAARVRPAVVNITTVQALKVSQNEMPDLGEMFPFFGQGGIPGAPRGRRG